MSDQPPVVELVGVTKTYEEAGRPHTVLRDVTLSLPAGAFVVVLGRSGSGKSTLLNLIAGIDRPSAGLVRVAGTDVTRLDERELTLFRRTHVGFVFQFFNLIQTLDVLENVRLPLELIGRRDGTARAMSLLERVGLADRARVYPDRLSGGEQQRVAVARALATEPPLILADEPTGNLDVEIGEQVLDLLCAMTSDRGRSLVLVTHSHRIAARADRVLRVEGDRVVPAPEAAGTDEPG